jgi:hypothetical protein
VADAGVAVRQLPAAAAVHPHGNPSPVASPPPLLSTPKQQRKQ